MQRTGITHLNVQPASRSNGSHQRPPASTGQAALANLADRLQLDLSTRTVYGDPDDPDVPGTRSRPAPSSWPAALADDWFSPGHADLLRQPSLPQTPYEAMYEQVSYEDPQPQPQMGRPGIRGAARADGPQVTQPPPSPSATRPYT